MESAEELRKIASQLRDLAVEVGQRKEAAASKPLNELDPEKVKDFLVFFGGMKDNG